MEFKCPEIAYSNFDVFHNCPYFALQPYRLDTNFSQWKYVLNGVKIVHTGIHSFNDNYNIRCLKTCLEKEFISSECVSKHNRQK